MKHHSHASRIPSFDQSPSCHSAEWKTPLLSCPSRYGIEDCFYSPVAQRKTPISSSAVVFFLWFFQKPITVMSRRKQRSAFDQVSEFDRGRIVPHWSCTGCYGMGRYSTPLVRIASTRGVPDSPTSPRCWSQLSFLTFRAWPQPYFNRIMRDHTWHALSKGSSSITRLNYFPGRLTFRIFHR
ncbi:uncharacterized protein TNCV_2889791 [Trichonephila clavipes]|nr:uncharacterized protein TNCV_2889791 [Trichonephila clavipes]